MATSDKIQPVGDPSAAPPQTSEAENVFVVVVLGEKRYGFPVEYVREIFQMIAPTPIPSWPPEVLGVMDVRGEWVPLVDISELLGLSPAKISPTQQVVVLAINKRSWGVVVDSVSSVGEVNLHEVREDESVGLPMPDVCSAVATDEQGNIVLLKPERLMQGVRISGDVAPRTGLTR